MKEITELQMWKVPYRMLSPLLPMCLRKLRPRETDLATYADSQRPIQKWVKIEFWHLKTRPSQTDTYRMSMSPEEVLSLRVIAKP